MVLSRLVRTDLELLEAWRSGDERAGNELFDRHFRSLYRFFRNKANEGIDDLVQQTFLACVEGRDRLRESQNFRAYMLGCARFIFYRECERRGKVRDSIDFGVTSVRDLNPGVSTVMGERAEHKLLVNALRHIPIDYQIAMELYHIEGMTGPEIAEVLQIPEATVRSRLRRGLEHLKRQIERLSDSPQCLASTFEGLEGWAKDLRKQLAN